MTVIGTLAACVFSVNALHSEESLVGMNINGAWAAAAAAASLTFRGPGFFSLCVPSIAVVLAGSFAST